MTCIGWKQSVRALLVAVATVAGLEELAQEAKAFQFNNGDLVLAIYGNNMEFYYDIGAKSTLLAPGAQTLVNISALPGSPFAAGSGVVGGPQTQWSIVGGDSVPTRPTSLGPVTYAASVGAWGNIDF